LGTGRGREQLGVLIEFGVEDRLDALAGGRTDGQRPPAGGFQALVAAVLGEVE
jgi:hypothetical protein